MASLGAHEEHKGKYRHHGACGAGAFGLTPLALRLWPFALGLRLYSDSYGSDLIPLVCDCPLPSNRDH